MCSRKCFLLALFALVSLNVFAEEWYLGIIHLCGDQVIKGRVCLRPEHDVVLFKIGDGEEVTVYPAYKVRFFELNDPVTKTTRKFASLHVGVAAKSFYQFYEIVLDGAITVFRRQYTMWYSIHLDLVDYDYYILHGDELFGYTRFKRKVYPRLKEKCSPISRFVKDHHINLSRLDDILKTIAYYNEEAVASSPVASTAER